MMMATVKSSNARLIMPNIISVDRVEPMWAFQLSVAAVYPAVKKHIIAL
jgi:hypothetical protein